MPLSPALAAMRDALAAAELGMTCGEREGLRYETSRAFGQARLVDWVAAMSERTLFGRECCYHLTESGRELLALLRGAS